MSDIDLNDEYEIESKIPDLDEVMGRYIALSDRAARLPGARLDLSYGDHARHRLDIFAPAGDRAAAQLFFHGGYWHGGSKESRRFPATAWLDRGVAWVPIEYRLAPDATLDEIVDDVRSAVAWFHGNAARFGCDPARIYVTGNSAGGHIVGMLVADGWHDRYGVPRDVVKAGCAISGLFDLHPLRQTFANDWLSLDETAAERNSPVRHMPRDGLSLVVAWGEKESDAFKGQSLGYAEACRTAGADVQTLERGGAHHFSIIGELGEPESPLFKAIAESLND